MHSFIVNPFKTIDFFCYLLVTLSISLYLIIIFNNIFCVFEIIKNFYFFLIIFMFKFNSTTKNFLLELKYFFL